MNASLEHGPPAPARNMPAGWMPVLLTAAVMTAFAASRLSIAGVASEREYDEGVYLLSARSLLAGHELFREVFSSQPPAFLETLALAMRVFGDTLETGRVVIVGFALLALAAVADLARRIAGPWAGPAAAAALALSTTFIDLGHVVEAELPALSVAMASLAACLHARRHGWHPGWLLATGALFALSALFKLLVAPLAVPLGLLLLLAPQTRDDEAWAFDGRGLALWTRTARRACLVAAGALAVGCVPLLLYDHRALYEQTIAFHLSKHDVYRLHREANLARSAHHLLDNFMIAATATAGVALLVRRKLPQALWLLAWFAATLLVLTQQTPLFWRHFVLLSLPMAVAAAAAVWLAAERLHRTGALAVTLAAVVLWAAPAVLAPERNAAMFPWVPGAQRRDVGAYLQRTVEWIRNHTEPEELVAGDDPIAIYLAGRQAPGALCDTSQARIVSRSLTLREATRESARARVIVLRKGGRLTRLSGYQGWLARNYEAQRPATTGLGTTRTIWIRKR